MRPGARSLEQLGDALARDLHDSVAQTLSTMLMELENFRTEQYGREGVLRQVDLLERSTRQALADLRRLLHELRAQEVGEEDLVKLVRHGMLERNGRGRQVEFGLRVATDWPESLPANVAFELHRVVAEAIENGLRHSGAKVIEVTLGVAPGGHLAVLTVSDDGRGLPKQEELGREGLGILGMRERANLLGGEIELESGPAGRGTTVRITVPLPALGRRLRGA